MNPILQTIITNITSHVQPEYKPEFDRTVLAGKKILFDPNFHKNMELVKNPESRKNPVDTISTGVTGLLWLLYLHSNKTLKPESLIMAGAIFMCEVMDFAERSLGIQITNEMVSETWKQTCSKIFLKLGITQDQLHDAVEKGATEIQQHNQGTPTAQDQTQAQSEQPAQPQGMLSGVNFGGGQ